jgi:TP901 family phage tail tape measure protein
MADTIETSLGFDVSQSLQALQELDQGFSKFQSNIQSSIRNLDSFNQSGGKTVAALIQIKSAANDAADALNRLNSIKPPPTTPGGGLPPLPTGPTGGLTGASAAQAMAQLLGQTTAAANAATPALNNTANAAAATGNALNDASGKTSGFAISLETLSRVVGTQVIVRALSAFRTAVEDSFQGFIDFNRKIAEIQTISPEPLSALSKGVRELSDQFNAPILDVATAKYQILSNGFEGAADSAKILTAALKFAKIGISDTTQAADLITAALNAYGKSASEADTISAKLFKTIELGRVVGSELTSSFARVAPIAKEVGASAEEILAGFSSITQGGVKASEAATQLRATLSGLLKPSKDTEEAFRKLGVTSGEQLIQAKGFQGALQALIGTTDGSASAIAKLFPNVRALNGVLRETTTGADIFQDHLKQIKEASAALLNQKFEIRIDSNAEKVSADLNRLKNFFTVDLGSSLVNKVSAFTALLGGVDTLKTGLDSLVPVIATVVTSLVAYNVGSLAAAGAAKIHALALGEQATAAGIAGASITGLVAVIAAAQAGTFIGTSINRVINAPFEEAKRVAAQRLQFEQDQADARVQIAAEESAEEARILHNAAAEARKTIFEQTEAAQESNKQIIEDDKATFNKIIAAREKFANDLKRAAIQADNDVTESRKRANDLQGQLDDRRFNLSISQLNDFTKASRESARAIQLANQASNKLANASKPEEKESAQNDFARATAMAQEAIATAKTTGNRVVQVQAERTLESILQRRINAESQFQKERQADADRISKQAADEEKRITELKSLAKDFLEKTSFFDSKHQPLSPDVIKKNLDEAGPLLDKFKEKAFGPGSKFNLQDLFSFDKLEARLNQSFTNVEVKNLFASKAAQDKLFNDVQGVFSSRKILVEALLDKSKAAGKTNAELADEVDAQANAQQAKIDSLKAADENRIAAQRTIAASISAENQAYGQQLTVFGRLITESGIFTKSQRDSLDALFAARKEINDLTNNPNATRDQVNDLASRLNTIVSSLPRSTTAASNKVKEEFDLLVKVFNARKEINDLDKKGQTPEALKAAQDLLFTVSTEQHARQFSAQAADAVKQSTSNTVQPAKDVAKALQDGVAPSAQIASNMAAAASAAAAAASNASKIGTGGGGGGSAATEEGNALGGFIQRFATGGFAKGTDTIPTVLSNREFVVNSRQAERFHPQLTALNAGFTPSFPSASNVTHNGINGDVTVNVAGGASNVNTRQIGDELNRLIRRGAIALKR